MCKLHTGNSTRSDSKLELWDSTIICCATMIFFTSGLSLVSQEDQQELIVLPMHKSEYSKIDKPLSMMLMWYLRISCLLRHVFWWPNELTLNKTFLIVQHLSNPLEASTEMLNSPWQWITHLNHPVLLWAYEPFRPLIIHWHTWTADWYNAL